ncbi:putative transcription factor C2H2 family [Lupinus albus]|uniref:Putative transcription factor C2H2 family n=1 Tax=Lupinus albus TaxID=3870 RepID=A0A6A4QQQ2_LUPAL|nr:putative transcription factor C2H2 family [Lupinus albus]
MASPAPESIFLEDFGQTVDLTRRIREVLLNYPEGTTVLKELIQNADDAGATRVSLCLDRRSHGQDSLLSDSLSQWQGPALLAFNDACFTEEDFVSISKIGGSSKQGQSWKTGRFGVGFNSVYHLTDLPSFVSGKYVVLFDPQGVYLPRVSAANPGKRIDFTSSSALSYCMDQFSPYCAFGCDMQNPFAGTLFRFPLRNADQAARSKLSRQAYSPEDISSMFVQLFEEGVLTLLFLKSVLCIEIYVWDAGEPEPKKIHSCSVSSVTDDTVRHRQALLRLSKSLNTTSEVDAFSLDFLTEAVCGVETERKTERFYMVQTMASASSRIGSFASTASKEYDIHLLPWASVAACISDNSLNNSVLRTGQAFCFLPLPVRTGLSVQVNGFFEVSSNRRGIWYGDDMDRSGKVRSNWNRLLLEDVVAPAFMHMLLGVKDLLGPTGIYYSLWPVGSFEEPWDILVQQIYKNIGNAAVLHSDLNGGRWVSPSQAFLHDEKFIKSMELGLALMQLGMPVVHLPNSLFDMLLKFNSSKVVTPATVRQFLRECEIFNYLSKQYKLLLLEYCLEDLVDDDVGKEAYNLPLLPLANGDFGSFLDASKGISYFICNELEYKLLQPVSDRVIDRSIPPNILCRLSAIAKSSKTNLTLCSIHHFAQLFPGFIPADWKYKSKVFWDPESCQKPSLSWFLIFWQYLGNQSEILQLFSDWPILPSTSGHLLRPSRQLKMINGSNLSDALQDILVKLGCNILNSIFVVEHMDLSDYVCGGSAAGVLESIFNAFSSVDVMQVSLNSLIAEERNELRRFLLDPKWYVGGSLDEFSIRFCKRLPVFQVYGSESAQDSHFSDLESPRKYLPPLDVPEFILGIEFIVRSSNLEEDILSRYYGVERMGKAQFYKQHVFSRVGELQAEVRDSIMLSVLQNLPLLCLEDISIRDLLRNLEFIPTLTGTLKRPSILYDPRNEELYALLEDSDKKLGIMITEQSTSGHNSHFWITTECLGGGNASNGTSEASKVNFHNFVPWACVATRLNSVKLCGDLVDGSEVDGDLVASPDLFQSSSSSTHPLENFEGRAFCFLPLPISTGLPAHVNAYFELSSNRRDIWFGSDMTGGGRKRSDWNIYLLENVVTPAYGHLLEKVALEIGPCNLFFSLWPTTLGLEPWASVVRNLYRFVAELNIHVLYTEAKGGQWISTKHAIFPDFTFPKATELTKALSGASLPVVTIPQSLLERFMEICPSLHFLTPKLLRTLLIRRKREFKDRNAMILTLEYCLYDLQEPLQFDTICGLPLLPLADGSFTSVDMKGVGERVYIARGDEYGLLKDSIPHQLVDCVIPEEVHRKLCCIAQTDCTNISFLSWQLLEKLLVKLLPVEWQHVRKVSWTPGIHGQPSLEWLQLLWNYLKLYCDDLLMFSKWPILPIGDDCLMQLTPNLNVIKNDGWSEKMSSLLSKVGCLFLRQDVQLDHPQLEYFVQSPTARGVLTVFLAIAGEPQKIEGIFADVSDGELHELRSFVLQSKWFSEEKIDDTHIEIIKHLPVFESYKSRKLLSLCKPNKWLGPTGVRDDLLNDSFIRTESEMERVIMRRHLQIKEPTKMEFYKDHIETCISEFLSNQEVVSTIMHDVRLLIEDDIYFKSALSDVPFVLAANGSWQQPSRLYDPRVPLLKKMLHGNVFFPSDKFLDPGVLDTLVSLGVRRTLGFTGLIDCARSVSMLHDAGDIEAPKHGRELLIFLDILALKLSNTRESNNGDQQDCVAEESSSVMDDSVVYDSFPEHENSLVNDVDSFVSNLTDDMGEEEFWSELKLISWCPVISDPLVRGLPWLPPSNLVVPPTFVRPRSQMWMVSSSMHILDGKCDTTYIQTKLGWMDCPNVVVLSRQLTELSKSYHQLKIHSLLDTGFDAQLQKEIPCLYSKMQEYIINVDDFNKLKAELDGVSWVWIGDDFVSPNALAFDSPVKFTPYLYVVPSELSEFKDLMIKLGVRLSFGIPDYLHVLQRLQSDVHGVPLSIDQLNFVRCVVEAIAECCLEKTLFEPFESPLWIPDASGVLMHAEDVIYNDAPWLENSSLVGRHFIHPSISNDLANRLGVKSVRCLSLASEDMTKDLPCMDYDVVNDLLALYGNTEFLLFDLLELADCCKAKKLHLIYDKREHPCQSLLQHNLGEYQGPALVVIFEGACLSQEEFSNFQLLPPWRLRGTTLNYGLGLASCYSICDLLSVVSGGYFYMFDPRGLVLAAPSTNAPSAKMFSLIGTDLTQRFSDQFSSMLIDQSDLWSLSDSTIIRMPLSSDCSKVGSDSGSNRIKHIIDIFMEHGSRALLFLKSVLQVSISTWEVGSPHPLKNFSISIDPSSSVMRNPFSEKKWRKFQLSRLFSSSNAAMKMHVIDVSSYSGGTTIIDRWLVVLSLGSGQTRNMALDRRYLAYNLTPVAGIAALISRNGHHANVFSMSSIMSPLPLSGYLNMPVTVLGCFLVCHNRGRYLFKYQDKALAEGHFDAGNQLIESWNRELMSCVCDSYVEMILEIQKLRRDASSSIIDSSACPAITLSLKAYGGQIYTFWPRSERHVLIDQLGNCDNTPSGATAVPKADWECLKERVIRPFYSRMVDLPVWQLYSGNLVKAEEGMFLSQPGNGMIDSLLPATVCSFVKEHHPVFSVPWELVTEIQAVGFPVREIRPKMVRELLKRSSKSIVLRSVDMYVDVLEYCLSDFQQTGSSSLSRDDIPTDQVSNNALFQETDVRSTSQPDSNAHRPIGIANQGAASSGDALEMVTSLGKALFDFGRVVVEDIGRAGAPLAYRNAVSGLSLNRDQKLILIAAELKGLPCPTASSHLKKLGLTELWLGNKEQQSLMLPLGEKFIHPKVLDRTLLCDIFSNLSLQELLKLQNFSLNLLASHMKQIFHKDWVNHVMGSNMVPWLSWEKLSSSGGQGGPSPEWIRVFWKSFRDSQELSLFSDWPLIPAFLGRPVLCRVRERHLVFIPPLEHLTLANGTSEGESTESYVDEARVARDNTSDAELVESYISAFHRFKNDYPWLLPMLNQCNIPIFDEEFIECASSCNCFPLPGKLLGQVIVSKLVAAKQVGYFTEPTNLSTSNCDDLFLLFSVEFFSNGISYAQEEIDVLRSLPIYKTVVGSYTKLQGQDQCMVPSNSFLKPYDEHCLSYATDSNESSFLRALGVVELLDQQILVRFALPDFERKPQSEQEEILVYVYKNWHDLQSVQSVVDALKETKFVRNSDEFSADLLKPVELFDPGDAILISIFFGERRKFPGERFSTDGWLRILRKLGLRTATEVDVIIECAKRVEFLGIECIKSGDLDDFEADTTNSPTEVSAEVWALGGSVVEFVFSNFALFFSNNFCDLLGKISFVPAELGFPNVGSKKVLASYSEAILSKDWPLAWSCAPILSKQHIIPPEYSWPALHLRSPPACSTVLKHLQVIGKNGGEDTLAHWPIASGMNIEECTCEILKYLGKIWDSLSSSDVAELRGVAFLPAANGTRLLTADALFARLMINLSPFAFELPAVYLPFVKILKDLGLQDTLTLSSAKDLLLNLQKACGYQHLNPNELRAVMEILNFICDQIVEGNKFDGYNWKSEAVVPDDGCRLVHSASCVYVDSYGSRYVKCIDTSRIRFVHADLPERVCFVLGIKKLSDAVIEELDENQQLLTLGSIGYVSLATIKHRLSSRSLQSAVWAVVNSMVGHIPAFNCLSMDKVQCLLNSTAENLEFVKHLKTRFMLLPNLVDVTRADKDLIIPEWKNESGHQTLYFINQSRSSILVAEPPNYISVFDLIAIVVSQVLGSPIVLPIGSLFDCPEGSEIAVVNVLKLCSEKKEVEPINGSNNIVGKEILPQDARLVQFHPLRPFYSGEIVAWRSQHGEKLKYGKVPEDVRPSAGHALYRFKIEVAPGVTQVFLSSQVFSFKSVSASSPLKEALMDDSPVVGSSKPHGELPQSTRRGESSSQVQPFREQSGKVSAPELVQAVNEILSAVGINIDVEKQALLQRTINLQENLQESHTALLLEQEKVERATKEADTAKAAWICRICLSAEVDTTLVPCGHVMCRRCSSAVSRCPFCRLQVTKAIRIYRP